MFQLNYLIVGSINLGKLHIQLNNINYKEEWRNWNAEGQGEWSRKWSKTSSAASLLLFFFLFSFNEERYLKYSFTIGCIWTVIKFDIK